MPNDPNNPNSNGPQNIIVNKISANQQDVSNMSVQRLNVATGEEKTGETDLLNEVRNAITAQTETLVRMLSSISSGITAQTNSARSADAATIGELRANTAITGQQKSATTSTSTSTSESSKILVQLEELNNNLLVAMSGGGGAGTEGGGGLTPSGIRSKAKIFGVVDSIAYKLTGLERVIQDAENLLEDTTRSHRQQLITLLKNNINEQVQTNVSNVIRSLQRFSASLVSTASLGSDISKKFNDSVSIAETGVANLSTAMLDISPGLLRGGTNLSSTFELVRKSINDNMISPIGVMGANLLDVSHNIRQARLKLRDGGATALDRLSYNTSNEAITTLLDLQRRSNVNASLTDSTTLTNMRQQLDLAQMIASNTGRTAAEVIKSNQQNQAIQRNMVAAGTLSSRQQKAFSDAQLIFTGRNQTSAVNLLQKVALSGGSVNSFLASNDGARKDLAIMGKVGLLRQLVATVKAGRGNLSEEDFANKLENLYKQFGTNRYTGVSGARNMTEFGQNLAGEAGRSANYIKPVSDAAQATIKQAEDFLANNVSSNMLKLTGAILWNTRAVWANTLSRGGGGIFGKGAKGIWRFGKGLLGIGGAVAGGAAVEGAVAGGTIAGGAAIAGGTVVAGGGLLYGSGKTLGRVMGKSSATISKGATALGRGAAAIGKGGVMAAEATSGLAKGAAAIGKGAITASKVGLVAGKVGLGATLRALPLIGVVAGLGYGAYKAYKGDYVGAGLSVAAGLAGGLEPGVGTAASVGLSAALAAHEMGVLAPVGDKSISVGKIATGANANVYGPKYSPVPKTDSIQMTPLKFMIDVSKSLNDLVDIGNKDILLQQTIAKNTGSNDISTKPSLWDSIMGPSPDAKNTAAFSK